jgi:lysophospholipase L1-like esterase
LAAITHYFQNTFFQHEAGVPALTSQPDDSGSEPDLTTTANLGRCHSQKGCLFRVGAVLLGLLPFILIELTLFAIDWKPARQQDDPFVGFSEIRPLFVRKDDQFEISKARQPLFQPDSFLAAKPNNEFRIFCVGGSTVQGRPFSIETAFSKWLELSLQAADSSRDWKVINCGGVSYASYRLAPIVDEIRNYQPDLVVLYTGHNEFLEDRTYESIKSTSPLIRSAHERLSYSRTYGLLRQTFANKKSSDLSSTETLPTEVEARLDFKNGLDAYSRDDRWKKDIADHYEHNLRRMIGTCQQNDVPLIVMNPVSNLRNSAPFKNQHTANFLTGEKEFFDQWTAALETPNVSERIERLETLKELNPRYAKIHFQLAQAYLLAGNTEQAKNHFIQAKEEDICPLRMTEPLCRALEKIQKETNVPFVDVKAYFESLSKHQIVGKELLLDHIHPSIHGHQKIGVLLLREMEAMGVVTVPDSFPKDRELAFQSHLESLPFMYFQRGKDRLAGLKRWTEGKVTKEREEE